MGIKDLLVAGLQAYTYAADERHRLLHQPPGTRANIGLHGENLTITCLSLNRFGLTTKLLQSVAQHIPDFAGEFLIVDNGSGEDTLAHLHTLAATLPFRTRVVALGKNYGVSGGRNRTMKEVRSDWVLCLDNDIYLTTNILPRIQQDLATLGCHFLNVPLLEPDGETVFALGGHLYIGIEGFATHLGAGSACRQGKVDRAELEPFLSTFMLGGACVFKKETFERLGGYDENMFIGFEDIDFSVRLFQEGYKVGTAAVLGLIHDHPPPTTQSDQDYERARFSRDAIHHSARYLESKHGFDIWGDGMEHWLALRHEALALGGETGQAGVEQAAQSAVSAAGKTRPKIALVIDVENWAFGNIARQLQRHLSDQFDFKLIPSSELPEVGHIFLAAADCDLVHFFWRETLRLLDDSMSKRNIERPGIAYAEFARRFVTNKPVTTSVYDHLFLDQPALADRVSFFQRHVTAYTVASERLDRIYRVIAGMPAPAYVAQDGVDLDLFRAADLARFQNMWCRPIVIGWAGNSKWASELPDVKGFHTVLLPAIELARKRGVPVHTRFADRQVGQISHAEMPAYYQSIDLYVCTSSSEGTPNPVLEAMACGVPVISTDVGIVPEALGARQRDFIVAERSPQAIADAIVRFHEDRSLFAALSAENLVSIQPWRWEARAQVFARFFQETLDQFSLTTGSNG